jgi:hypothetical protein
MFAFFKKLFAKADANKDGKVDVQDAKVVAESVKAQVKTTAARTKTAVKKPAVRAKAVRKPRAK